MLRDATKKLFLVVAYRVWRLRRGHSPTLTVLTYHRISEAEEREDPLKVSLKMFERQIRYVRENYSLVSADDLSASIERRRSLPTNACLITFDDGWRDNFELAFPILKRYQIPALIFLSTDYIGSGKVFWQVRVRELLTRYANGDRSAVDVVSAWPAPLADAVRGFHVLGARDLSAGVSGVIERFKGYSIDAIQWLLPMPSQTTADLPSRLGAMLSWDQVGEMAANGVSFGSHCKTHSILTRLNEAQLKDELVDSKHLLEDRIHRPIDFLAYPNGDYDERVLRIANEAGYLAAFTCRSGVNVAIENPLEIRRINMREDSAAGFGSAFSSILFRVELSGIRFLVKDLIKAGGNRARRDAKLHQSEYEHY